MSGGASRRARTDTGTGSAGVGAGMEAAESAAQPFQAGLRSLSPRDGAVAGPQGAGVQRSEGEAAASTGPAESRPFQDGLRSRSPRGGAVLAAPAAELQLKEEGPPAGGGGKGSASVGLGEPEVTSLPVPGSRPREIGPKGERQADDAQLLSRVADVQAILLSQGQGKIVSGSKKALGGVAAGFRKKADEVQGWFEDYMEEEEGADHIMVSKPRQEGYKASMQRYEGYALRTELLSLRSSLAIGSALSAGRSFTSLLLFLQSLETEGGPKLVETDKAGMPTKMTDAVEGMLEGEKSRFGPEGDRPRISLQAQGLRARLTEQLPMAVERVLHAHSSVQAVLLQEKAAQRTASVSAEASELKDIETVKAVLDEAGSVTGSIAGGFTKASDKLMEAGGKFDLAGLNPAQRGFKQRLAEALGGVDWNTVLPKAAELVVFAATYSRVKELKAKVTAAYGRAEGFGNLAGAAAIQGALDAFGTSLMTFEMWAVETSSMASELRSVAESTGIAIDQQNAYDEASNPDGVRLKGADTPEDEGGHEDAQWKWLALSRVLETDAMCQGAEKLLSGDLVAINDFIDLLKIEGEGGAAQALSIYRAALPARLLGAVEATRMQTSGVAQGFEKLWGNASPGEAPLLKELEDWARLAKKQWDGGAH